MNNENLPEFSALTRTVFCAGEVSPEMSTRVNCYDF